MWLLDTGPIVGFFASRDPAHRLSVDALRNFKGRLITTGAVITEAMYFAITNVDGPSKVLEFLESSGTEVVECCQLDDLQRAVALMNTYADTPMDFADATLVLLADQVGAYDICTLDRRGFQTFRTERGKRFRLVLDQG